jgi:hypothetical protein
MMTVLAYSVLLAFIVLFFFAGLPDFVDELQGQATKRRAKEARRASTGL